MPHRSPGLVPRHPIEPPRDPAANARPDYPPGSLTNAAPILWGGKPIQDMPAEELRRALIAEMHMRAQAESAARLAVADAQHADRYGALLPCIAAFALGAAVGLSLAVGF